MMCGQTVGLSKTGARMTKFPVSGVPNRELMDTGKRDKKQLEGDERQPRQTQVC